MRLRIRIPGLDPDAQRALDRRARLILGRHAASIEAVEVARVEHASGAARHADCEVAVTLREGGTIRVHDDGAHVHRALLRAAWRIDQRRELGRLRDAGSTGATRRPF